MPLLFQVNEYKPPLMAILSLLGLSYILVLCSLSSLILIPPTPRVKEWGACLAWNQPGVLYPVFSPSASPSYLFQSHWSQQVWLLFDVH